jgi:prepilin signal peptidase PulO-like enzyme (type II secretory pathway)
MKLIDWSLALFPFFIFLLGYLSWKDIRFLFIETQDLIALACYTLLNIVYLLIKQDYSVLFSNLLGASLCFLIFLLLWILTKKRGIGEGELIFVPVAYFNIGLINSIEALYFCFFSAMLFSLVALLTKRLKRTQALPFIPFLSLGLIFSLFFP